MQTLRITVSKSDVYADVRRITSVLGSKSAEDGSLYRQISAGDEHSGLLDIYFDEAMNNVKNAVRQFISEAQPQSPNTSVVCLMPDVWNDKMGAAINSEVKQYVVSYILSKWLRLTKGDMEELNVGDATMKMGVIGDMLYSTKRVKYSTHLKHDDSHEIY